MKTRILKLSALVLLLTVFFGCCEDCENDLKEKGVEIKTLENKILEKNVALEDCNKIASKEYGTILLNPYKPNQELISMNPDEKEQFKNSHFKTKNIDYNKFDTHKNNGEIYLKFPVHNPKDKNIEIVDVINVSSENINAIVVLLNGLDGRITLDNNAEHFLKSTIEIEKVEGLSKTMLDNHEKLKLYVFHDNAFYSDELIKDFRNCVEKDKQTYKKDTCQLSLPKWKLDITRPREQEGDIITGG